VSSPQRLAVIFDAVEERWPSMNYVAEMLLAHLQTEQANRFQASGIHPRYFGAFERVPALPPRLAWNADRLVTRFLRYPIQLLGSRSRFDFFHVADHSYAQLVHALPIGRVGVYCHDLDAFEPILGKSRQGSPWRGGLARILLAGLRQAAVVFFSTWEVRDRILSHGLVAKGRLVHAPYGLADEYWTPTEADLPLEVRGLPYLLNVAGNYPRKRLDVLFRVFARLRHEWPELRLVQHGAELTPEQRQLTQELGIADRLLHTAGTSRAGMAALYHGAKLLLITSEREGFGLPALEAMAAGAVVVMSDIPNLREIAGGAGVFCPVGEVDAWVDVVGSVLAGTCPTPPLEIRLAQARKFSWAEHARIVADAYARLGAKG
jgi:glycosyltransferase involved in cell wall biosynthesis